MVSILCEEGPTEIERLLDWSMRFDTDESGTPTLAREGGHRCNRILHTDGAATGTALAQCLLDAARNEKTIRLFDHCTAIDLLTESEHPGSPVLGVLCWHPRYGLQVIWAGAVVLASGGAGRLFRETSNPPISCGDGIAMAYRAGAAVAFALLVSRPRQPEQHPQPTLLLSHVLQTCKKRVEFGFNNVRV